MIFPMFIHLQQIFPPSGMHQEVGRGGGGGYCYSFLNIYIYIYIYIWFVLVLLTFTKFNLANLLIKTIVTTSIKYTLNLFL